MYRELTKRSAMKKYFLTLLAIASLALTSIVTSSMSYAQSPFPLPEYSKVYDDSRDPFKDALAAIALAKQTNRNVLIEIGGNWCTWCHKMDAFLAKNADIYQQLHQNYVLLKVNVSDSNSNQAFMKGLPPVLGYPHMYISNGDGKMLLSKDTAELLVGNNYSRDNWLNFLAKWQVKNTQSVTQSVIQPTTKG